QTRPAEVWTGMASLADRQGKGQEALAILNEAEKAVGDRVEIRLARARYWSRRQGAAAREAVARLAEGLDKFKAEDRSRLLRGLADASTQLGEKKEAERLWRLFAALQPKGS